MNLLNKIKFDTNNIPGTKVVIGSGRSGTTWISHLLNYENKYRYIFEPLHHLYHQYSFPLYPIGAYLRADQLSLSEKNDLSNILSEKIHNTWMDRFNTRLFSTQRIIKFIRASFLISAFTRIYPGLPVIYVLRHPLAVVNSRLNFARQDHSWVPDLPNTVIVQHNLVEDYLEEFLPEIYSASSDFEKCLLMWCIQNYVGLKQLKSCDESIILYYEKFHGNFEYAELSISKALKIDVSKIDAAKLKRMFSREFITSEKMDDRVAKWKETFSSEDLVYAEKMLYKFGLDNIYSVNQFMPL